MAESSVDAEVVDVEIVDSEIVDIEVADVETVDSPIVEINEVTEAEDDPVQELDESEERPAKARLPWARFMTKSAHDSGSGSFTTGPRQHERRFKLTDPALKPGTRLCRLCFTVIVLKPEYIETSETLVYVTCPHCERSFPIRRSDV